MNIREIARRAKVSTATVSRPINRHSGVQPQLAKRVLKVVEEIGSFQSTQARALVSGRSRIFSEITNPFLPEIVHVFEEMAIQHNYEIRVTSAVHDTDRMKIAVRRMLEHCVEGVAVMTFGMEESLLGDLKRRNVPLVFVEVGSARLRVSNMRIDYLHGIRQAGVSGAAERRAPRGAQSQRRRVRPENEFHAAPFDGHEFPETLVQSAAYRTGCLT